MARPLAAGSNAHAAAAAAAAMSDQTIGLLLALSSSLFIGASFVIKKRGLRRAGSTGLRAGRQVQFAAAWVRFLPACLPACLPPACLPARTACCLLVAASRQRRLLLPAGASVVAGPGDHGGGGGGQLCGLRLCARHPGHTAGRAQHHHQASPPGRAPAAALAALPCTPTCRMLRG